jgi:hypothetical protein
MPPVCAASFQAGTYYRAELIRIDRWARMYHYGAAGPSVDGASVRANWSCEVLCFARRGGGSARQKLDANRVQEIIRTSNSRSEAVRRLRDELGWSTSPSNLSKYLRRHCLSAIWQKDPPEHNLIVKIAENVRTETEALRLLRDELGWSITAASLSQFMRNHGLSAPWQYLDPLEIGRLVQESRSLNDAAGRILDRFGRAMSRHALSAYIRRHHIGVPWVVKPR